MNQKEQANYELFAMDGEKMINEELDIGIINGMLTGNGPCRDTMRIRGLFAPPFVSSDFNLDIRLFGQRVKATSYRWYPSEMVRHGRTRDIQVDTALVYAAKRRGGILKVSLKNLSEKSIEVPLQIAVEGTLDYNRVWNFFRQLSVTPTQCDSFRNGLVLHNNNGTIAIDTTIDGLEFCSYSKILNGKIKLNGNESKDFFLSFAIGYNDRTYCDATLEKWTVLGYSTFSKVKAVNDAEELIKSPEDSIEEARKFFAARVENLRNHLPKLTTDNKPLERWYQRSMIHALINQWVDVPEFFLKPYYSTGSLNGGCCCLYLWDFGANCKLWGLIDPETIKKHFKAFLNNDLRHSFAFLPMDGSPYGPWYYINQEKIIFCIYYYVLHTGDTAFLHEKFNGRTIIEHVVEQALICDDLTKEFVLVDYGAGNHHLELLKEYRYDNILPDLNLRRAAYYHATDRLCRIAGFDATIDFAERAEAIRKAVSDNLYDPAAKWFSWQDPEGNKINRYTIQMFKVFGHPENWTLTEEQRKGLLSHINDKEFLGEYGMHSMSKMDPAYDQSDIDNGGGGSCQFFAPVIAEKLYFDGEKEVAYDLLRRIFWWADHLPYWSDSLVANFQDYRKNTPLQNAIGGLSICSTVIFGVFGISVDDHFKISIRPNLPPDTQEMCMQDIHLAGKTFDVNVNRSGYTVKTGDRIIHAKPDETTVI